MEEERGVKGIDRTEKRSMWLGAQERHIDLLKLSYKVQSTATVLISYHLLWTCARH